MVVEKADLMREIETVWGNWDRVAQLAQKILQIDPGSFDAATALQAAYIELVGRQYPCDPHVQAAVGANRLVRELAHTFGLERTGR